MTGQRHNKQTEPERLTRRISFRVTEAEYAQVSEELRTSGINMSSLVRKRLLGRHVLSRADLMTLAELRRLGGLLKHTHNETRGAYSALTAQAIRELSAYSATLAIKSNDSPTENNIP